MWFHKILNKYDLDNCIADTASSKGASQTLMHEKQCKKQKQQRHLQQAYKPKLYFMLKQY